VSAPLPVSVTVDPLHMIAPEAEAVTCGTLLTVMRTLAAFVMVQPVRVLVPLTVYVAEAVAVKETPLTTDGNHVYVSAPFPDNVTVFPAQTTIALADAETTGRGFTVKDIVAGVLLVQPVRVLVPETE